MVIPVVWVLPVVWIFPVCLPCLVEGVRVGAWSLLVTGRIDIIARIDTATGELGFG
jgi:hypothetical protein